MKKCHRPLINACQNSFNFGLENKKDHAGLKHVYSMVLRLRTVSCYILKLVKMPTKRVRHQIKREKERDIGVKKKAWSST